MMEQIGRYQITGELGRGAMGVVYRAVDPAIGRPVAIKTIRLLDLSDTAERERLRERLFREARSAGILSHPGIVTVYDVAEQGDVAYIAMEFVNGPTLEKVLGAGEPLSQELIFSVLRQTAAALDYAHKKGIIHRDIKPANIMIDEDGTVKITDFGIAKIAASQQLTQVGLLLGTPNYMSPEQIQGKPVEGRTDQFCLGVIAYELVTGEKPFTAEQLTPLLYKIVSEEPVAPRRLNPSLGPEFEPALRKALAKDPAGRYVTCVEFVDSLAAAAKASEGWKGMPRGTSTSMDTVMATGTKHAAPILADKDRAEEVKDYPPVPLTPPAPQPAGGSSSSMGTVMIKGAEHAAAIAADQDKAEEVKVHEPVPLAPPAPQPAPRKRSTRNLATLAAALGIVALLVVGWQRWFSGAESRQQTITPALIKPETTSTPAGPSAGQPVPKAARSTPAPSAPKPEAVVPPAPPPPKETMAPKVAAVPASAPPKTAAETGRPLPAIGSPPATLRKPGASKEQTVQVTTNPAGATVIPDNNAESNCKSPCSFQMLPGRHTFSATLEGYRNEMRIIEVTDQALNLSLNLAMLTGQVLIVTAPPGASISVNDRQRPEKTPTTLVLAAGSYKIVVTKEGFKPEEQDLEVRAGAVVTIRFALGQ